MPLVIYNHKMNMCRRQSVELRRFTVKYNFFPDNPISGRPDYPGVRTSGHRPVYNTHAEQTVGSDPEPFDSPNSIRDT